MLKYIRHTTALAVFALAGACSGGDDQKGQEKPDASAPPSPAAAVPDVKATGKVIVVELYTDEKGNYFKPAKFEVHRGDLIRFTLMSGVHNVNFLADSNAGKGYLPPASDFLQIPGQTYDLLVSLAEGRYYFQCDPHALLGMIGYLEVEDESDD